MHCLNPDRLVIRGGVPEACAGAIADIYQVLGGRVTWYGKPHQAIYAHALHRAGDPPEGRSAGGRRRASDRHPRRGAEWASIRCSSPAGSTRGEPFPEDFAAQNGLGGWQPVAVVDGLA